MTGARAGRGRKLCFMNNPRDQLEEKAKEAEFVKVTGKSLDGIVLTSLSLSSLRGTLPWLGYPEHYGRYLLL